MDVTADTAESRKREEKLSPSPVRQDLPSSILSRFVGKAQDTLGKGKEAGKEAAKRVKKAGHSPADREDQGRRVN